MRIKNRYFSILQENFEQLGFLKIVRMCIFKMGMNEKFRKNRIAFAIFLLEYFVLKCRNASIFGSIEGDTLEKLTF